MRTLFFGDVMGRTGRESLIKLLPSVKHALNADFCVVNGENAAHGFGITKSICDDLYGAGVDSITLGNHAWDQREVLTTIDADTRLIRPANYPRGTPGRGAQVFQTDDGRKVLVINVMGRLFMDPLDDPFAAVEQIIAAYPLGGVVQATILDIHAEATSEKQAMAHAFDGRITFAVGTHTHVPTADSQILPGGTAYQTDAGMCGDYNSVIGHQVASPIHRFTRKTPGERMQPAEGPATICGVFVESDDRTGLARTVSPIRLGGRLAQQWPLPGVIPNEVLDVIAPQDHAAD